MSKEDGNLKPEKNPDIKSRRDILIYFAAGGISLFTASLSAINFPAEERSNEDKKCVETTATELTFCLKEPVEEVARATNVRALDIWRVNQAVKVGGAITVLYKSVNEIFRQPQD